MNLLFKSSGAAGSVWVRNTSADEVAAYELDGATGTLAAGEVRELALAAVVTELLGDPAITVAMERAGLGEPTPERWRVSKDTIITRLSENPSDLANVMTALGTQSAAQQFIFTQSAWFWSDNPTIRGLATALGLDPDELLAADPYLF